MTRRSLTFLSTAAALALFGGLHLEIASGRALDAGTPGDARLNVPSTVAHNEVDRSTKGDREDVSSNATEGRTIVFQHPDLQSTTVAVRLWETASVAKKGQTAKEIKPGAQNDKRKPVACEGVVSVLTEVAKQLEAGRCVT